MAEIKQAPINLQVGDQIAHPWGVLEILDIRGTAEGEEDTREWYVRDPDTGEELWVDFELLVDITTANVYGSSFRD